MSSLLIGSKQSNNLRRWMLVPPKTRWAQLEQPHLSNSRGDFQSRLRILPSSSNALNQPMSQGCSRCRNLNVQAHTSNWCKTVKRWLTVQSGCSAATAIKFLWLLTSMITSRISMVRMPNAPDLWLKGRASQFQGVQMQDRIIVRSHQFDNRINSWEGQRPSTMDRTT